MGEASRPGVPMLVQLDGGRQTRVIWMTIDRTMGCCCVGDRDAVVRVCGRGCIMTCWLRWTAVLPRPSNRLDEARHLEAIKASCTRNFKHAICYGSTRAGET
eukprot:349730-Chlamydomonas_euryale.AAC.6